MSSVYLIMHILHPFFSGLIGLGSPLLMVDLRYRVLVYLDYCLTSFGHAETVYYTPDSRVNHFSFSFGSTL